MTRTTRQVGDDVVDNRESYFRNHGSRSAWLDMTKGSAGSLGLKVSDWGLIVRGGGESMVEEEEEAMMKGETKDGRYEDRRNRGKRLA